MQSYLIKSTLASSFVLLLLTITLIPSQVQAAPLSKTLFPTTDSVFENVSLDTLSVGPSSMDVPSQDSEFSEVVEWLNSQNSSYRLIQSAETNYKERVTDFIKPTKSVIQQVQEMLAADPSLYPSGRVDGNYSSEFTRALDALDSRFGTTLSIKDKSERRFVQVVILVAAYESKMSERKPGSSTMRFTFDPSAPELRTVMEVASGKCPYRLEAPKDMCKALLLWMLHQSKERNDSVKAATQLVLSELGPALTDVTRAYNKGSGLSAAEKKFFAAYLKELKADVGAVKRQLQKGRTTEAFIAANYLHSSIIQTNLALAIVRGHAEDNEELFSQLLQTFSRELSGVLAYSGILGQKNIPIKKILPLLHKSYAALAQGKTEEVRKLMESIEEELSTNTSTQIGLLRESAKESSVKQSMASMRPQAEIIYAQNNSYSTVCSDSSMRTLLQAADDRNEKGAAPVCKASATEYVVSAPLRAGGSLWCIDSTGFSGEVKQKPSRLSCGGSR